jgi:pimeloyl-ACP methyl ester carboxylesterase
MALNNYTTALVEGLAPQPLEPPAAIRLSELRLPVLALMGELDSAGRAAAASFLAREAADVRVVRYPDAAHLPNLEHPTRFNADLRSFLDGLAPW